MTCRYSHTLLIDHLTGELVGEELLALEAHLASCDDCRATLAVWREAFEDVSELATPVTPPPEIKAALLARIRDTEQADIIGFESGAPRAAATTSAKVEFAQSRFRRIGYAAAVLVGVLIGAAGTRYWWMQTGRDPAGNSSAAVAIADYRLNQALEAGMRGIAGAEWYVASFAAPAAEPGATVTGPQGSGLLAWDAVSQQLHFYALGLKTPPAGSAYRLWLIDHHDQWVRVGELNSDGDVYQLLATTPLSWSDVRSFVVTQEHSSASSASAPSASEKGPVMLRSNLETAMP